MPSFEERLDQIALDLKIGKLVEPVIIRKFMEWADIERRTRWNVDYIDRNLEARNLITVPNYKEVWVDNPMLFQLQDTGSNAGAGPESPTEAKVEEEEKIVLEDPSFKIGDLHSARTPPIIVDPEASLPIAVTLMMANDFSQLPVGSNHIDIKSVISWKSIALRIVNGSSAKVVKELAEPAYGVLSSAPIFGVVQTIAEHDYVLVRSREDGAVCGIVTGSDLSLRFEEISAPFLLISEIETHIRNRIENMLPQSVADPGSDAESAKNNRKRTFYDYIQIMRNKENWHQLRLHVDQNTFCADLDRVRKIRNNIMHFSKDPLGDDEIRKLRSIAKMLEFLRNL